MSIILIIFTTSCQFLGFGDEPPCGESILQIEERTYQIKNIETKSDGSIKVPANKPDVAYWVNQTEVNYVFALSPTSENLALQNTKPEQATVTWANCNSSAYVLSAPQIGMPDMNTLLDQSFSGITIFVQSDKGGFVIKGEFTGEEIQSFDTPDPASLLAEISLLEVIPSDDKTTITIKVSITNYGQNSITLTTDSVALILNDSPAGPLSSEPSLPREIASGGTETFAFTFAYPSAPGATLKIFSAEYEVEGY